MPETIPRFVVLWHFTDTGKYTWLGLVDDRAEAETIAARPAPALEPGSAVALELAPLGEVERLRAEHGSVNRACDRLEEVGMQREAENRALTEKVQDLEEVLRSSSVVLGDLLKVIDVDEPSPEKVSEAIDAACAALGVERDV